MLMVWTGLHDKFVLHEQQIQWCYLFPTNCVQYTRNIKSLLLSLLSSVRAIKSTAWMAELGRILVAPVKRQMVELLLANGVCLSSEEPRKLPSICLSEEAGIQSGLGNWVDSIIRIYNNNMVTFSCLETTCGTNSSRGWEEYDAHLLMFLYSPVPLKIKL